MPDPMVDLHVLCSDAPALKKWQAIQTEYSDLRVNCTITECAIETIREISRSSSRPFLVCRDNIWIGRGMGGQIRTLLAELDGRFPNWALCGNRGVTWDGQCVLDYSHEVDAGGLETSVCAHAAISVSDDLLLVNPMVLNSHRELAPPIQGRCGVLLSLECLRNGSALAVSPRLMVLRCDELEGQNERMLEADPRFSAYYRSSFLNHHLATPEGMIDLSRLVDYGYVSNPQQKPAQEDILDLYDRCMEPSLAIRRPSLTICCRTQFQRPEMLDRAVLSFAAFRQQAGTLADIEIRLISDLYTGATAERVEALRQIHPGAGLECWRHELRAPRFSRTDLLLTAIERAGTDYIWFVDDDDFANAGAAPALARCLIPGAPLLIVTSAAVVQEKWTGATSTGDGPERELLRYERFDRFHAAHLYRVLRGRNFIPNCGMVFPVRLMQRRIANLRALGNYNEDYFLLLAALTAPRVEVRLLDYELSSVSMRGEENTVAQKDQAEWRISLATFLLEILNDAEGSPFLWQLGNAPRW